MCFGVGSINNDEHSEDIEHALEPSPLSLGDLEVLQGHEGFRESEAA